ERLAAALAEAWEDRPLRERLSQAGRALIDGQGADRVCRFLAGARVRLRRAAPEDVDLLFDWVNDPVVRACAFQPAPVPREEHVRWLTARLSSPETELYIGVDEDDRPVGQVRLDRTGPGEGVVSISVERSRRGGG